MKIIFYTILSIHCLVETAVAILMWVNPEIFSPEIVGPTAKMARSFGIGAGTVALLGFLMLYKRTGDLVKFGALTLMVYHLGILTTQIVNEAGFPWAAVIFHGVLVTGFGMVFWKGKNNISLS